VVLSLLNKNEIADTQPPSFIISVSLRVDKNFEKYLTEKKIRNLVSRSASQNWVGEANIRTPKAINVHLSFVNSSETLDSSKSSEVLTLLKHIENPGVLKRLKELSSDKENYVRILAVSGLMQSQQRDYELAKVWLADPIVREATAICLIQWDTEEAMRLLEPYLTQGENFGPQFGMELASSKSNRVTNLLRRILKKSESSYLRTIAIGRMAEVQEKASLPAIRKALASEDISEKGAAAEAIASMQDRKSIPLLTKLLLDSNPHGRLAGARALVGLRAKEAIPALKKAVNSDTSWAKSEIESLLIKLEGS
jgi:HEAT repeat protein